MWMVGCNDGHDGFNISDSNGWRLRPLVPRPTSNTSSHPCLSRIHGSDLFPLNTNLGFITEQNKQELSVQTVVSSRWNPTPEQLRALEDLYRCGTRTPTAEQIQHITAQLRRFGKIEGKNVFYWFQNHKARERQKRRRRLESAAATKEQQLYDIESLEKKDSGSTRNGFEVERNRNCSRHTNFSTFVEESVSMQKPTVAESRAEGWIQFEEGELQQIPSSKEILATWQMMHLSSSTPSHLVNTITTATTTEPITTIDQNLMISKEISSDVFRTPNRSETLQENLYNLCSDQNNEECEDSNTLQLFPVSSDNADNHGDGAKETKLSIQKTSCDFTPYPQFFEFFPMKN